MDRHTSSADQKGSRRSRSARVRPFAQSVDLLEECSQEVNRLLRGEIYHDTRPFNFYTILQEQLLETKKKAFFTSEGTALITTSVSTRIIMEAQTRADDGMDLLRVDDCAA